MRFLLVALTFVHSAPLCVRPFRPFVAASVTAVAPWFPQCSPSTHYGVRSRKLKRNGKSNQSLYRNVRAPICSRSYAVAPASVGVSSPVPVRSPLLVPVVVVVGLVLLPALIALPTPVVSVPDSGARLPAGALGPPRILCSGFSDTILRDTEVGLVV